MVESSRTPTPNTHTWSANTSAARRQREPGRQPRGIGLYRRENLSLHSIPPEAGGKKLFLEGGKTKGGYYRIGGQPNTIAYICEGFATGASIREATGETVFVAFTCGNLKAVAQWVHRKYPNSKIVFVADNDLKTEAEKAAGKTDNPGVGHALDAAAAVGGTVVIPTLAAESGRKCDANDLHVDEGIEAVRTLATCWKPGDCHELST